MTDTTPVAAFPADEARRVFLIVGEESGDRLGAALIRALRTAGGGRVVCAGIGGPEMAREGVAGPFPIDELAIIGFVTVVRRLPQLLRRIREAADAAIAARPDALVIIDSPDFTHRVARRVRRLAPRIPIIDYVAPTVWAWRPGRARRMRSYVDHVLALLPFEPEAFRRLDGPPCTYVGHPLAEAIAQLRPNAAEAQRRERKPPILLVLPGSRASELRRHMPVFGAAIERLVARVGPLECVLPTVPPLATLAASLMADWPLRSRIVTDPDEKLSAFRNARAALAKSGTVTLELALAGIPHVAAYKVSPFDALMAHLLVRIRSIILANLVLGEDVVPQILQSECTPERLADALAPLIGDTPARARQVAAFARLDAIMQIGQAAPARRAAETVLAAIGERSSGHANEAVEKQ